MISLHLKDRPSRDRIESQGASGKEDILPGQIILLNQTGKNAGDALSVLVGENTMAGKTEAAGRREGKGIPLIIQESIFSTAINASLGTWTVPN